MAICHARRRTGLYSRWGLPFRLGSLCLALLNGASAECRELFAGILIMPLLMALELAGANNRPLPSHFSCHLAMLIIAWRKGWKWGRDAPSKGAAAGSHEPVGEARSRWLQHAGPLITARRREADCLAVMNM